MRAQSSALLALNLVVAFVVAQNDPSAYQPNTNVACPAESLLREFTATNQSLNPGEQAYVDARSQQVLPLAWKDWVGDGSSLGYNLSAFQHLPKVGIAISGGGYRAAQYGAGVLSGLDARNDSAKAAGTGGLLQISSYLSGLSGGSWLTGSLYLNNFPTIQDLVLGNPSSGLSGWLLDLDLATPGGIDLFGDQNQYWFGSLLWSVISKAQKGVDTSITDPWGRMIAYHFLNGTTRDNFFTNNSAHGAGQLWSSIPNTPSFQAQNVPFPIVVADSRPAGSNLTTRLDPSSTVYEITPMEFASYDPSLSAGMNITYIGTHLSNGKPNNGTACVTAFDQASFMMGSSASLFNQIFDRGDNVLEDFDPSDSSSLIYVLKRQLSEVRTRADDVANWPNPFNSVKPGVFQDSNSTWLELIDGSSNAQNVPLDPMFVRARNLDLIVAVDGSADTSDFWPNGSSIVFTQDRLQKILLASHQQFPPTPDNENMFISTGVSARPTLFGCNPTRTPPEFPLVLYLPNSPPIDGTDPVSNTGTFKLDYTQKHTQIFLDQVHGVTTGGFVPGSLGADPNFGNCMKCAAIDRARLTVSPAVQRSDVCQKCFQQYCFDPSSPPKASDLVGRKSKFKDPDPQGLTRVEGFFARNKGAIIGGFVGLFVLMAGAIAFLIWRRKKRAPSTVYKNVAVQEEEALRPAMWKRFSSRSGVDEPLSPESPPGPLVEMRRTSGITLSTPGYTVSPPTSPVRGAHAEQPERRSLLPS